MERGDVPPLQTLHPPSDFSSLPRSVPAISIRGPDFRHFLDLIIVGVAHDCAGGAGFPTQNAEIPSVLAFRKSQDAIEKNASLGTRSGHTFLTVGRGRARVSALRLLPPAVCGLGCRFLVPASRPRPACRSVGGRPSPRAGGRRLFLAVSPVALRSASLARGGRLAPAPVSVTGRGPCAPQAAPEATPRNKL